MPVLSGIDCVKQIRADEKKQGDTGKRYWAIGCTGQARPPQIKEGIEAGLDRVLTKPCELRTTASCPRSPSHQCPLQTG